LVGLYALGVLWLLGPSMALIINEIVKKIIVPIIAKTNQKPMNAVLKGYPPGHSLTTIDIIIISIGLKTLAIAPEIKKSLRREGS